MKYLSPQIQKMAKQKINKGLAKPNISCGIFQDIGSDKYGAHKAQSAKKNN